MASHSMIRWCVTTPRRGPAASRMIQAALAFQPLPAGAVRVSLPGAARGMASRVPLGAVRRVGGMADAPAARRALMMVGRGRGPIARSAGKVIHRRSTTQAASTASTSAEGVGPIPYRDLFLAAFIPSLPWFAMGFIDNSVMLIAGSWLDAKLGVVLGLSALGAAAAGNMFSDVIGAGCASTVEDMVRKLGLPTPNLSAAQRISTKVRTMALIGAMVGVACGCMAGDFPLLYIDQEGIAEEKRQQELKSTFDAVVEEVHLLMECDRASLWMIDAKKGEIYTKTWSDKGDGELRLPYGKGIIGLAMSQQQLVRVDNVQDHPAFLRRHGTMNAPHFETKACMTMPIFDQEHNVLGAIQVLNKHGPGGPQFNSADEERLRNLSKVVQVAVQHCFNPPDTKKDALIMRLKQHATCPTRSRPSVLHKEHVTVEVVPSHGHAAHAPVH